MSTKILIFLIAILLLNNVSAVDIQFFKDKYMTGDSVQAWIDFENLSLINPLTYSNIKLYNNGNKIPLNLNLYKIEDKYFVYFILPELEAKDYNFILENILYSEKNSLKKGNFHENLSVVNGKGISVNPALIYLNVEAWENPRISFEIKNKAGENINLSFESLSEYIIFNKEDKILKKDETYLLNMILDMKNYPNDKFNSELIIKYLNLSYKIPIIANKPFSEVVSSGGKVSEDVVVAEGDLKIVEDVDKVERSLKKESNLEGPLRFKNFGNKTLYGLSFELTNDLNKIIRYKYEGDYMLEGGEQESVYLYINEDKNLDKNYSGDLIIKSGDRQVKFPFFINYIPEETAVNKTEIVEEDFYNYNYTKMPEPEKKSKTWIYILFAVFFIVLIYLIYYFYKKGKPETKKFESLIPTFGKR